MFLELFCFSSNLFRLVINSANRHCLVVQPGNETISLDKVLSWPKKTVVETNDLIERIGDQLYFRGRADNEIKLLGRRSNLDFLKQLIIQADNKNKTSLICNCEMLCHEKRVVCVMQLFKNLNEEQFEEFHKNLRVHLLKEVPEIFIPMKWVCVPCIPYNRNGKADKPFLMKIITNCGLYLHLHV